MQVVNGLHFNNIRGDIILFLFKVVIAGGSNDRQIIVGSKVLKLLIFLIYIFKSSEDIVIILIKL